MIRCTNCSLLLLLLALTACKRSDSSAPARTSAPASPPVKAAPATPLAEKKDELGSDNKWTPEWDAFIEKSLPPELLSPEVARAVRPVCPAFAQASEVDKRAFWAYTLQAMAAAEAGLEPTANVRHTEPEVAVTDTSTHRPIRQQGLLQLAYQDADRYGCEFDAEADSRLAPRDANRTILRPDNNLACGLKILRNQIVTQRKPLLTRTSYWSVLQPGTRSYRVFARQMANVPAACRPASRHAGAQAKGSR